MALISADSLIQFNTIPRKIPLDLGVSVVQAAASVLIIFDNPSIAGQPNT